MGEQGGPVGQADEVDLEDPEAAPVVALEGLQAVGVPMAVDGAEGRRVLKLALEIGRLVRERLARFAS